MSVWLRWDDGRGDRSPSYYFPVGMGSSKEWFIRNLSQEAFDKYSILLPNGEYTIIYGEKILSGVEVEKDWWADSTSKNPLEEIMACTEYRWYKDLMVWSAYCKDTSGAQWLEVWTGRKATEDDYLFKDFIYDVAARMNFVPEQFIGKYSYNFIHRQLKGKAIDNLLEWNGWYTANPICISEDEFKQRMKEWYEQQNIEYEKKRQEHVAQHSQASKLTNFLLAAPVCKDCVGLQPLIKAIKDYTGLTPRFSAINVLTDKRLIKTFSEEDEGYETVGRFDFDTREAHVVKGRENDVIHELIHSTMRSEPYEDMLSVIEGVTELAADNICRLNHWWWRRNDAYMDEVSEVRDMANTAGMTEQELIRSFLSANDIWDWANRFFPQITSKRELGARGK